MAPGSGGRATEGGRGGAIYFEPGVTGALRVQLAAVGPSMRLMRSQAVARSIYAFHSQQSRAEGVRFGRSSELGHVRRRAMDSRGRGTSLLVRSFLREKTKLELLQN